MWDRLFRMLPARRRPSLGADKMYKAALLFRGGGEEGYRSLVSAWDDPDSDRRRRVGAAWSDLRLATSPRHCRIRSTACNISIPSPICLTTS